MKICVGLTGPNASGKGEVSRFLADAGFSQHSLSDVVREEAARQGLDHSRESLIKIGTWLRETYGPGILAERTLPHLGDRSVVDSIRNPGEIQVLRRLSGFLLLGVDAPLELRFERSRLRGILTVALGVGVLLGPVLLMRQKSVDGGGSGLSSLIASYFGQGGYGEGLMTWPLALKRLTVVGIIGVLPLWAVLAVIVWHLHVRKKSAVMVALAPLGAALFGCLAMRNPMAHHQWIACSVISLGILVSLQLLLRPVEMDISTAAAVRPATESRWFFILLAIACFGYGQVIGAVNQTNFANVNALVGLVQEHTPRSALICIGPDLEAQLSVEDAGPMLDRHVRSFGSCSEGGAMQRVFVVNSRPLPGWQSPVATARSRENPLLGRVLGWYTAHITKRKTLRLQLPKNYLLYEMLPRTQLLPPSATRSIVTPDGPSAIAS